MSAQAGRICKSSGFFNSLPYATAQRVQEAVRRALFVESSVAATCLRTGLCSSVVLKLRSGSTPITRGHLEKLAPLIDTDAAAVLSGAWSP